MSPARRPRISVAGVHADWLRLVEPNGPFLTLPVLRRVWPNGLDHVETDTRAEVRRRLADLDPEDPGSATAWIEWVLTDLLSYGRRVQSGPRVSATLAHVVAEHGTVLRPDHVLDDGNGRPRLLVMVRSPEARLDARPVGDRWSASPVERLALLCRASGVELGLATNATNWVLVWAPKDGASGTATFSAELFSDEPVLLDAFTSVLGARRFFAVAEPDRLEALLAESASAQAEVTGKLGQQVRQAVELLVAAMSRADRDRHGALLADVDPHQMYESAVAVLMRLVLLLYAEERALLPLGDDLYDRTLAGSTLLDQLRETQADTGDEPLERSHTAWHRLLALFRAVHAGIDHDRLRIPAYGGGLFDPDRFPFLEGRRAGERWHVTPAEPLPVDDLTVLAMLSALQELRFTEGGVTETRRLTYRALDVEQIGHVYEGLLDHSAVAVTDTAVGLVGKTGIEPEVTLDDLAHHAARGRDELVAWLVDTTRFTPKRVERLLDTEIDADTTRLLRAACDNHDELTVRLAPYVNLLRRDLRGLPTVFTAGSMYVTQTGAKRDSGTAYTTKELADEVVEHALAPLVYSPGPADGANSADWKLRSSAELLDLKVCDPAVGSGAILVAACRYLAARLVEAWTAEGAPEGDGDPDEVGVTARRAIADRCLYGVDRDPMAVEMAKLSLWLVTLSKERPFSFLDHAVKPGDSLLGITDLEQLRVLHLDPAVGRAKVGLSLKPDAVDEAVECAVELRRRLESIPVVTVGDAEDKARLNVEANEAIHALQNVSDLVVGYALRAELPGQAPPEDQMAASAPLVAAALDADEPPELRAAALEQIKSRARQALDAGRPDAAPHRHPLHWPLAFPEVFVHQDRPGFDALVGNPPFLGGTKISGPYGADYRRYLAARIAVRQTDRADLVVFFLLRARQVIRALGTFGFLATNTVSQGDSREVGTESLLRNGCTFYRAHASRPWPGSSTVEVAALWCRIGPWMGACMLGDEPVVGITASLSAASETGFWGRPELLASFRGRALEGSKPTGSGFVLTENEAAALVAIDDRYREVVVPYLSGQDLNSSPSLKPSRWIINFHDWPLSRAAEYPAALALIEERVRPIRATSSRKRVRELWWQFEHPAEYLYEQAALLGRVIGMARVSKAITPEFLPKDIVVSDKVVVFLFDSDYAYGVLASTLHWWWADTWSPTLRLDPSYNPSDSFETFPWPSSYVDADPESVRPYVGGSGRVLSGLRRSTMSARSIGITGTFNLIHDSSVDDEDITRIREAQIQLDCAVATAYGWTDVDLEHGFWNVRQGTRFTVGPNARTAILDRMLQLNHERYAEEVAAGLHDKRKSAGRGKKRASDAPTLL